MTLTVEEVRHIASLARIALDDEHVERLQAQLSAILDHFDLLGELDTSDIPPTAQAFAAVNVMREDSTWESWPVAEILAGAPRTEGDYIRVRAVFE